MRSPWIRSGLINVEVRRFALEASEQVRRWSACDIQRDQQPRRSPARDADVVHDVREQGAFMIAEVAANLRDASGPDKRRRIAAARGPAFALPRGVARSSLCHLIDDLIRDAFSEGLAVDERRIKAIVSRAVGDAPWANAAIEI